MYVCFDFFSYLVHFLHRSPCSVCRRRICVGRTSSSSSLCCCSASSPSPTSRCPRPRAARSTRSRPASASRLDARNTPRMTSTPWAPTPSSESAPRGKVVVWRVFMLLSLTTQPTNPSPTNPPFHRGDHITMRNRDYCVLKMLRTVAPLARLKQCMCLMRKRGCRRSWCIRKKAGRGLENASDCLLSPRDVLFLFCLFFWFKMGRHVFYVVRVFLSVWTLSAQEGLYWHCIYALA